MVFLDRDNTLIANDGDLGDPARVQLLDGVPEGLRRLREAGYRLVVVTNQGGVARGRYAEEDVEDVPSADEDSEEEFDIDAVSEEDDDDSDWEG